MLFFLSHLSAHTRPTPYPRGFLARTRPFRRISVPGLRGPCARSRMPLCPLTGLPQPRPVVAAWGGASVSSLLDAVLLHECSSVWFLCGPTGPHQPLSAPACFHFACCAVLSSRLRPSVVSSLLGTAGPAPPPLQPLRQVWRPGPLSSRGASGVLGPGCARPELPLCVPRAQRGACCPREWRGRRGGERGQGGRARLPQEVRHHPHFRPEGEVRGGQGSPGGGLGPHPAPPPALSREPVQI